MYIWMNAVEDDSSSVGGLTKGIKRITIEIKPVKANNNASIVTAIETAGSGADDKVCINFAKFVNNLCISSYTIAK